MFIWINVEQICAWMVMTLPCQASNYVCRLTNSPSDLNTSSIHRNGTPNSGFIRLEDHIAVVAYQHAIRGRSPVSPVDPQATFTWCESAVSNRVITCPCGSALLWIPDRLHLPKHRSLHSFQIPRYCKGKEITTSLMLFKDWFPRDGLVKSREIIWTYLPIVSVDPPLL